MSSLQNTAKTKIANALKSLQNMDTKTERSGQKGTEKNIGYSGASQDCVPLKDIVNGIYITDDNRYLAVVEILPTKYDLKSPQKQEYLLKVFGDLFRKKPYKWQMKTMNDIGTCKDLIKNIETNCPKQDDPNVRESMHAYIKFINSLIDRGSVVTRFFYIWEYHNTDLDKPTHEEKVQQMIEIRNEIVAGFNSVEDGNIALYHENESLFVTDFIYKFFNRRTYEIETLQERYNRMSADYERFNKKTGANKKLAYKDLVASKGIYFIDSNCMVMDGMYYSFIGIMGDSWPCDEAVPAGWLNTFSYGAMVDIDVIGKILPEAATKLLLSKYNDLTEERARSALNKGRKKGLTLADNFNNNKAVLNAMKKGEDLYDVAIILTVRASTKKLLKSYMRQIKKHLTNQCKMNIYDNMFYVEKYFSMVMPFLNFNDIFYELAHNTLTTDITSLYNLKTNTIYDPSGYVLGKVKNEIVCINNFNTQYFENANMLIFGTTGAGKTYTIESIGHRLYMQGIRCYFIIPKKGFQMKNSCTIVNGLFASIGPGSKFRINVMEIRSEGKLDESKVKDDTVINSKSLLAKQINDMIIWLNLNLDTSMTLKEYNRLNVILTDIYNDFGITDDNDSIFEDLKTKKLKKMPILGDLYDRIVNIPELSRIKDSLEIYIHGNCQNMNGQTNIDLENPYIIFDVDEDNIGERLLAAFLFPVYKFVYGIIKATSGMNDNVSTGMNSTSAFYSVSSAVFMDEVWKMMKNRQSAEQIQNMVKLIRGYGGATIISTQQVSDLLGEEMKEYGETLLACSAITLLKKIKPRDMPYIRENYSLTDEEAERVIHFKRQQGLLITNGDNMEITLNASPREYAAFNDGTDKRYGKQHIV